MKREALEELNVDIDKLLRNGSIKSIKQVAKATSPHFNPLRFETYFYLVECTQHLTFDVDEREAQESGWVTPSKIVGEYYQGKRLLVRPVLEVYKKLADKSLLHEFYNFDERRIIKDIPSIENIHGVLQLMPESNTIPPASRTNCFVIGDGKKIVIDPSPKTRAEFDKLCFELESIEIEKIFITHHHKDHHQYATEVAKRFSVPLFISEDSFTRIQAIYGEDYFEKVDVRFLKDGDQIGFWLKKPLIIHAIPGHDEGHLGLAPETLEWFIVGDLFQGIGTVVVGGDEGDMQKYMESLNKVIKLKPGCVIPSHGIPLGGASILEKTFRHREMREEQIFDLHQQGKDLEQILQTIYFDVPKKVLKYARANIESHLLKLKHEGRI